MSLLAQRFSAWNQVVLQRAIILPAQRFLTFKQVASQRAIYHQRSDCQHRGRTGTWDADNLCARACPDYQGRQVEADQDPNTLRNFASL